MLKHNAINEHQEPKIQEILDLFGINYTKKILIQSQIFI